MTRTGLLAGMTRLSTWSMSLLLAALSYTATDQVGAAESEVEPSKLTRKLDVWYVATPHEVVDRMLSEAKVRTGDVVYDLGCGDGRMVIAAAKKFGTRGIGIDLDPARIKEARASAKAQGV